MKSAPFTHGYLRSILDYDPETGVFVWTERCPKRGFKGRVAGNGGVAYRYITINGKNHQMSILAWFHVYGEWPERHLRYADNDAGNVRIANLRLRDPAKFSHKGRGDRTTPERPSYPVNNRAPSVKAGHLRARFGMELKDYVRLLDEQNGVCAICERPETRIWRGRVCDLAVDHDHSTGMVRALLCFRCNNGIGHLRDDPNIVDRAAAYLRRYAAPDNVVPLKREA